MAQKKSAEVDRWLSRPDPQSAVVLVYGPDRGLVSERAGRFAAATGVDLGDPFCVVKLDGGEIDADPGRLFDEAGMVPLFGGRRLIWIRDAGAQKALADAVKGLLEKPPQDAAVLIEAGDLKKNAALRLAVEKSPAGMALPCYGDDARGIDAVLEQFARDAALDIAQDARILLKTVLGGDRLAIRGELEKLALYCQGQQRVERDDVLACCGDIAATSADAIVDAVLAGDLRQMDRQLERHAVSGSAPFLVLAAATRQFQALSVMRDAMDRDRKSASAVVASARPPVFFTRRALLESALRNWPGEAIASALERLHGAVLLTRRRPDLAIETVRQTMLALGVLARRAAG